MPEARPDKYNGVRRASIACGVVCICDDRMCEVIAELAVLLSWWYARRRVTEMWRENVDELKLPWSFANTSTNVGYAP